MLWIERNRLKKAKATKPSKMTISHEIEFRMDVPRPRRLSGPGDSEVDSCRIIPSGTSEAYNIPGKWWKMADSFIKLTSFSAK